MASKLNLDALIPREDFEVIAEDKTGSSLQISNMQIRDLGPDAFLYRVLRKPDFQRETSEWSYKKVCDFIGSFINGDLIPAIILWRSGSYIFVIDGAHRLSALIAWVNNDYGDGKISKNFFEHRIPDEQIEVVEDAQKYISRTIGSYEDLKFAITNPHKSTPDRVKRAQILASLAIQLQWVNGDFKTAEQSFFKINQEATPINKTEQLLLKSRKKPNAIAARAIIRSGTGHKYWSSFAPDVKKEIEDIATEINKILFEPDLRTPIKTLDLPVAGQVYSGKALPLIFDVINTINKVDDELNDDKDGTETIKFLKNTRRIIYRISGLHPSSLGLHPIVYFYSSTGRYQPYSFLAIIELLLDFEKQDYFKTFTKNRKNLEEFLLNHKDIQNQIAVKYSAGKKGYPYLKSLYMTLLNFFNLGLDEYKAKAKLLEHKDYSFLKLNGKDQDYLTRRKDFDSNTKSQIFLRDALKNPLRCQICHGLIHINSISIDHIQRKQDGGIGVVANAQLAHPYCNTTYKN